MKNAFAVAAALCLGIVTGSASDAVRTLAGAAQVPGHVDGVGALARFSDPAGLAIDAQGNVLIADSANHCLRKLTPAGIVTTIAGRPGDAGSADGPGATARFDTPSAVAVAKDGTVFVSDTGNHTLRRIGRDGSVSTWAGSAGDPGATNAVGRAARFSSPLGIAIAKDGALFVADSANHAIRRVGADGAVTTLHIPLTVNHVLGYANQVVFNDTGAHAVFTTGLCVALSSTQTLKTTTGLTYLFADSSVL